MKKWFFGFLGVVVVAAMVLFYPFRRGVHFAPGIVQGTLEGEGCPLGWRIPSEPLKYLGHGDEAIAFETADGKEVLKFITTHRVVQGMSKKPKGRMREWLHYNDNEVKRGKETLKRYEKAFELLREETGLIALHIHPSDEQLPSCKVIDYRGRKHTIDLNQAAFIVQKKGEIIDRTNASREKVEKLFKAMASKGFISESVVFNPHNYALIEGKAVMIDLGKLKFDVSLSGAPEEAKLIARYLRWAARAKKGEAASICRIDNSSV